MIKNYFKIAFRSLWKHRTISFINLAGLAAGMSSAFLIFLFVRFEFSYDQYNVRADRIYRIACDVKTSTQTRLGSMTSEPMAPDIKSEFAEVADFVRLAPESMLVRKGDVKFQEQHIYYADSSLLSVFSFDVISGDTKTPLSNPFSVILTQSTAAKYFGKADPVGQTIFLTAGNQPAKITAIIKDIPENSHFRADIFLSMRTLTEVFDPEMHNQWNNFGFYSYLLLKEGANPKNIERQFPTFLERHIGRQMQSSSEHFILSLEPLKSLYLRSERDSPEKGNIASVYIFAIVAVFILFIACINFINLTTARGAERAKEIGVRKLIGAERGQLTAQFLGESLLQCLIAFCFAILFCILLLPFFNLLTGKTVGHTIFENRSNFVLLFLLSIGVGIIAGFYPAIVLSAYRPITVLRGRFTSGNKGTLLRKVLVVGQFTISIILIIGTFTVSNQIHFMLGQDLGFKKDQTIIINYQGDERAIALKRQLNSLPQVLSTTLSSSVPGSTNTVFYTKIESKSGEMLTGDVFCYNTDFDFLEQYGIRIIAGRGFSRSFGTDCPNAMVINEAALSQFGFRSPGDAIAQRFEQGGRKGTIIGVMKDFHFEGLQQKIKPLSMRIEPDGGRCTLISIRLSKDFGAKNIEKVREIWNTVFPDRPFSYDFLDEAFNRQYQSNERFKKLFLYFAILGIVISCLGLLGLASYSTVQRTREIGIRKVFGTPVLVIVSLLTKDFLKLVFMSFVIATPIAWFTMQKWLQDFAYRVSLSWWIFVLAGVSALLIATLTVSYQAIRAGLAKPINTLRVE